MEYCIGAKTSTDFRALERGTWRGIKAHSGSSGDSVYGICVCQVEALQTYIATYTMMATYLAESLSQPSFLLDHLPRQKDSRFLPGQPSWGGGGPW